MSDMHGPELLLLLLGALVVTSIARRLNWSAPLVLVAVGLVVSFIPGVPEFELDPHLILVLVLPPLLYSAALDSSYLNIRANLRPIGLLAVGLVLFTTFVVGVTAKLVFPELPFAAALVLGAVVAPPDAVAAVAIGRKLGLQRRAMTLLVGESLINDATALTAFKVAVAAAAGAAMHPAESVGMFLLVTAGGIAIGLLVGVLVRFLRKRLCEGVLESALGLLVPFGAYLLAEEAAHVSGVLAVVVAGLYVGHHSPRGTYTTRLQDAAVWRSVDVLLESFVFALIGLQVSAIISDVDLDVTLLLGAGAVLLATILARFVWMYPASYVPLYLSKRLRERERWPHLGQVTVIAWAGMRGVVTLAAAAAIPQDVPGREIIVFCAFVVTVSTLLLQGTTLPWVINKIGFEGDDARKDALAEAQIQHRAAQAAVDRLDQEIEDVPDHVRDQLRALAEHRGNAAWERLGRQEEESPAAAYRRLRRMMLSAERDEFIKARDVGEIDDEVLFRVLRELDLEEAALSRE
ncbi:sodium/proton antiporter (CPA1 family) [Lentzea atacamensis]|uniref:Sodium/proton antiporter (CPA1 family) n=1 Tax=Lentzea atacamensis TaxID=531938 RepID=A0ABX9EE83_9PSEU|nr:Na+/H+ antiporter [Lentzea atacamensis]RAS68326.1 sodium/proton antiporter (CPA1 family) [Lentzea atacamensis]